MQTMKLRMDKKDSLAKKGLPRKKNPSQKKKDWAEPLYFLPSILIVAAFYYNFSTNLYENHEN